jgi:FkbM family methyltransferase
VGKAGEVHAFEPVPQFYESIKALAENNPHYRLRHNLKAIGATPSTLPMSVVEATEKNFNNFEINIGSSSLSSGFLAKNTDLTRHIEVEVTALDTYISQHSIDLDRIGLIKIDVEGFEAQSFLGMKEILTKPGKKVPILCEVLTDESRGLRGVEVVEFLKTFGYQCYEAITMQPINTAKMQFEENILCV